MTHMVADLTFIQGFNTLLNVFGLLGIIAGVVVYFRFRVSAATIKLYQDNQQALDERIDILEGKLNEATLKITALQNQLDVVKDLPLNDIATKLNNMVEAQNVILATQNSILAHLNPSQT